MNAKQNSFQNAFQNSPQLQNFTYKETSNPAPTLLMLILVLILLFALMRSEARTRELLKQLGQSSTNLASR